MANGDTHIRLDQDLTDQMTVNKNLSQEIIVTNTDKVTILLNEHHKIIKKKSEWIGPLGIFLSILATLLTAKFDEAKFGVSAELWNALFIIVCIAAFGFSIYFIIVALYYFKSGTVKEFINRLKNQTPPHSSTEQQVIFIKSAKYGAEDKFIDVTTKISELIKEENIDIKSSNELVDGKDPIVGKKKELIINYSINKVDKEITIGEGKTQKLE